MATQWSAKDLLSCTGSKRFAGEMAAASPFSDLRAAIDTARDIWFNKVDVPGWLEAFAAHPEIGAQSSPSISAWSREEQSAAIATAMDSTMQELVEWNEKYREKFGFVFLICASGRSTPEILAELKKRYMNRPILELEIAAQEEMKIIELRLAKLFGPDTEMSPLLTVNKPAGNIQRTRPPITTHVLDVSRGCPAPGIEVHLDMWKGSQPYPSFRDRDPFKWVHQGSSVTDKDGRSGPLMSIVDQLSPGFYRISFNTSGYNSSGFYPYVSIVFQVRESQTLEHFHVPILLSPFSFTTYRGS